MRLSKKLFSSFLIAIVLLISTSGFVFAETAAPTTEISSFELFWPIVAGKTMGDSIYSMKSLKEKIRGFIIFGAPQKADYAVFLATKRVVEAEKLINEGKNDLANKTLEQAGKQLDKAIFGVDKALARRTPFQAQAVSISNRLSNLEIFIPWLINKTDKNRETLTAVLEKVELIKGKL